MIAQNMLLRMLPPPMLQASAPTYMPRRATTARAMVADRGDSQRSALLEIAYEADKHTHNRPVMTALRGKLQDLADDTLDPTLKGPVTLQDALMVGYLGGPMRNPKVVESEDVLDQIYAFHARLANETFLFNCRAGASVLASRQAGQHCAVNVGSDACLLAVHGGLGVSADDEQTAVTGYVNAVRTSASDRLVTVQAQGPTNASEARMLVAAAASHARQTGCKRVVFVNASTKTIAPFGDTVAEASTSDLSLTYREVDWTDGEVPQTPQARAGIVNFARTLADEIFAYGDKVMVVFNCHYGLDRSGVLNAIVQGLVDHFHGPPSASHKPAPPQKPEAKALSVATRVLSNIKRARPHGLSTVFRFRLVVHCLQDLCAA